MYVLPDSYIFLFWRLFALVYLFRPPIVWRLKHFNTCLSIRSSLKTKHFSVIHIYIHISNPDLESIHQSHRHVLHYQLPNFCLFSFITSHPPSGCKVFHYLKSILCRISASPSNLNIFTCLTSTVSLISIWKFVSQKGTPVKMGQLAYILNVKINYIEGFVESKENFNDFSLSQHS